MPTIVKILRHSIFLFFGWVSISKSQIINPYALIQDGKRVSVFLTLHNPLEENLILKKVDCTMAGSTALQTLRKTCHQEIIHPITEIRLLPHVTTHLKPEGLHIQVKDLKIPLKAGEIFPLILDFEHGKTTFTIKIDVPLKAATFKAKSCKCQVN